MFTMLHSIKLAFILPQSSWRCSTFIIKSCCLGFVYREIRIRIGKCSLRRGQQWSQAQKELAPKISSIKINFLFKQMGQTHVNKLFKVLLNSQGVPFKIRVGCQIWCLIIQRVQEKFNKWSCVNLGEMGR
jgi:hypothetical protein